MLLPAAVRYLAQLKEAGVTALAKELQAEVDAFVKAIKALQKVNAVHPEDDILTEARYMRDEVIPAMDAVRAIGDRLERVVADDLWPLPKYSEILFIR